MNKTDAEIMGRFLAATSAMQVHSTAHLGNALKKPLLLLLVISRLEHSADRRNRFDFSDIRGDLSNLIRRYGGRATTSGPAAEQPFSHLRTSGFWRLTTQRSYTGRQTALVSDLMNPDSYAALEPEVYRVLSRSKDARAQAFQHILDRWWPDSLHDELRAELGMETTGTPTRARNAAFVDDVLANYRFACAFCGFHAILNRQSVGVDACHIHWHSAGGPDATANGIALCRLHHWAFDKGVMTLDPQSRICTASTFVVHSDGGLPIHCLAGLAMAIEPRGAHPSENYLEWHRANVFLG
jgi:putative restriction endonuclease